MTDRTTRPADEPAAPGTANLSKPAAWLRAGMEAITLALVCASPWAYGSVHPGFEWILLSGIGSLLVLWGAKMLLEGYVSWQRCPVVLCLAGIFLLGVWQITPLAGGVMAGVSPGTATLYGRLFPSRAEEVTGAGGGAVAAAGETISLYPWATRRQLVRLLAVIALFAVVRNEIASTASLRRLGVTALINGACLSLFALVQYFSSPPDTLYWSYPSLGAVFGPFICRNHFPFYLNLCVGLGVGVLLSRGERRDGRILLSVRDLLRDPAALWICISLALMLASVAVCLSRGGMIALVGGLLLCLALKWSRAARSLPAGAALVVAALATLLVSWLGFGLVQERLSTLWRGEALQSRLPIWSQVVRPVKEFPVWGTGFGSFVYVEPVYRTTAEADGLLYEHAHNDYLEMLVEGGAVGLALGLLAVGLVFRLGYRAISARRGRGSRGLALGALLAFATFAIHSFGDFGLHIPAITLLATVAVAHLSALGSEALRERSTPETPPRGVGFRLGGAAPWAGAGLCVALAYLLFGAGRIYHRVDRLQAAADLPKGTTGVDPLRYRILCLEQATGLDSDNVDLQISLGYARARLFELESGRVQRRTREAMVVAAVPVGGGRAAVLNWCLLAGAECDRGRLEEGRLEDRLMTPAIRNYLRARACCPILSDPHLFLATYGRRLKTADPWDVYLDRVKRLAGAEANLWYLCGVQELLEKSPDRAWASWRRCLELSDQYLPPILATASRLLPEEEMVEVVFPDRPLLLWKAAFRLYPDANEAPSRRPFLRKALRILEQDPHDPTPDELHVMAIALEGVGRPEESLDAYRRLLGKRPEQADWRFERARLLREQGRLEDARREVVIILAQQPRHGGARELQAAIAHDLAQKR